MLKPPAWHDHATPHRRHLLAVGSVMIAAGVMERSLAFAQDSANPESITLPHTARSMVSARLRTGPSQGIPLAMWNSPGAGGAVVIGVHSFGDYRMAFAETAERLSPRGHTMLAYDQPGFGATPARGAYASDDAYREHLAHVVRFAKALVPRRPIVIMAESFGASVAVSAVARALIDVDGLILSGPGARENFPAKRLWDSLISGFSNVFGRRSANSSQTDGAMSDIAQLRFASDPMVVRDVRADTYKQVAALADLASAEADKVRVPTLVLYGDKDSIIARPSIDALMARLASRGRLQVYQKRSHLVLQARDRTDVDRDVLSFLNGIVHI